MKEEFELIAKTFQGLEEVRAKELTELGASNICLLYTSFGFLVFRYFTDSFGNRAVGQQHKFFYQLIGFFGFFEVDTDWFAGFVYLKFHFYAVKVNSTCLLYTSLE